jgi:uncharacterized protein YceH (UPF0502 family)
MSSELEIPAAPAPVSWPVLTGPERRILGVLVEKGKTTPDVYPMSLNSLVSGCNQKSNRDPLMNLSDVELEEALDLAMKKGLVIKVMGGRVERWRQALYEAWQVGKVELAILAELLLRGPQTEGELRGRASRMDPIDDLETLRSILRPLAERRLIVYLTPEGRRGTILTHGFHSQEELQELLAREGAAGQEENASVRKSPPVVAKSEELASLGERVTNLERAVGELAEQIRQIKESLGVRAVAASDDPAQTAFNS